MNPHETRRIPLRPHASTGAAMLLTLAWIGADGIGTRPAQAQEPSPPPAAKEVEAVRTIRICPFGLNGIYNGIFYYYAYSCDINHTPASITSTSPLPEPLGCVEGNVSCHNFTFKEGEGPEDPGLAHQVSEEARAEGLRGGKLPLEAPPYAPLRGEGVLIATKDYEITGKAGRRHFIRTSLVLCTPSGGTAEEPLPPVLMGIGQELAGTPDTYEGGASRFETLEQDRCYIRLRRKSDLVEFHVLVAP